MWHTDVSSSHLWFLSFVALCAKPVFCFQQRFIIKSVRNQPWAVRRAVNQPGNRLRWSGRMKIQSSERQVFSRHISVWHTRRNSLQCEVVAQVLQRFVIPAQKGSELLLPFSRFKTMRGQRFRWTSAASDCAENTATDTSTVRDIYKYIYACLLPGREQDEKIGTPLVSVRSQQPGGLAQRRD